VSNKEQRRDEPIPEDPGEVNGGGEGGWNEKDLVLEEYRLKGPESTPNAQKEGNGKGGPREMQAWGDQQPTQVCTEKRQRTSPGPKKGGKTSRKRNGEGRKNDDDFHSKRTLRGTPEKSPCRGKGKKKKKLKEARLRKKGKNNSLKVRRSISPRKMADQGREPSVTQGRDPSVRVRWKETGGKRRNN